MLRWLVLPYLLLISIRSSTSLSLDRIETKNRQALVNTSNTLHIVSDHFLSITFDPHNLPDLPWADPSVIKMARELSPAWFKISSPEAKTKKKDLQLSLYQWAALNHFTSESGLKQMWDSDLFSRAARRWKLNGLDGHSEVHGVPKKHEFPPLVNQIGFTVSNTSMSNIATIKHLFPRYDSEILTVIGPGTRFFSNYDEVQAFSNWLKSYAQSVSAISWSPSALIGNKEEMIESLLTTEHSELFKLEQTVVKGMDEQMGYGDKQLWIDDMRVVWEHSELGDLAGTFGSALVWLDRLGAAAVSGVDVGFQPNLLPMHVRGVRQQPSPDYWVAVLHKRLVGSRVLQVSSQCEGNAACRLYAHCTPNDDSSHYHPGSVTMFAINMKSTELRGNVVDWHHGSPMHLYVLTGDVTSKQTYLNDDLLEIDPHTGDLPPIRPNIIPSPKNIVLPPYSMAFWVFPNIKASACDTSYRRTKRETTHMALVFPIEEVQEKGEDKNKSKQKRCHNKNLVPVAPPVLPKIILDSKIRADECPPGCRQCNKGPCQIQGLNIVAPGCSTSDLLQRLIDISRKRRTDCCCDGDDGISTVAYDTPTQFNKRLQLPDKENIGYTANTPTIVDYSYTSDGHTNPREHATTIYQDKKTQYTTENYNTRGKEVQSVLKDCSIGCENDHTEHLVQEYRTLLNNVGTNNGEAEISNRKQIVSNNKNIQIPNVVRTEYNTIPNKYNSDIDGASNYQYQKQLYTKSYAESPTTPFNSGISSFKATPQRQNIYDTTTSIKHTNSISRAPLTSAGMSNINKPSDGYPIPVEVKYDSETPQPEYIPTYNTGASYNVDSQQKYKSNVNIQKPKPELNYVTSRALISTDNNYYTTSSPTTLTTSSPSKLSAAMNFMHNIFNTDPTTNNEYKDEVKYSVPMMKTENSYANKDYVTESTPKSIGQIKNTEVYSEKARNVPISNNIPQSHYLSSTSERPAEYSKYNQDKLYTSPQSQYSEDMSKYNYNTPSLNAQTPHEYKEETSATTFNKIPLSSSGRENYNSEIPTNSKNVNVRINSEYNPDNERNDDYTQNIAQSYEGEQQKQNSRDGSSVLGRNNYEISKEESNNIPDSEDNNVQGRLLGVNKNILPPHLYPHPYHMHPSYLHHSNNLINNLKQPLLNKPQIINPYGIPELPKLGYNNNLYTPNQLPVYGGNELKDYSAINLNPYKKPNLYLPSIEKDYNDEYFNQYHTSYPPKSFYENNLLGGKGASLYDPRNNYKVAPPLRDPFGGPLRDPFGGPLSGPLGGPGGYGLRMQADTDDSSSSPSPPADSTYATDKYRQDDVNQATYTTPVPNRIPDIVKYTQDNYNNLKENNKYPVAPFNPNLPHYNHRPDSLPILAEECVLKCAGNKVCDQNSLFKFVETIFRQLIDNRRDRTLNDGCYGSHSCGGSKVERELNNNEFLIDSLKDVLARGTDPQRIKLGSVYVECPSECQAVNPCVDQFSRKIKIILSIISWLKECITKK